MRKPKQVVAVYWIDAHTPDSGGWCDTERLTQYKDGTPAISVGYLMSRDEKHISVAGSITLGSDGDVEQVSGTIVIPAGMVKKVRVLSRGG